MRASSPPWPLPLTSLLPQGADINPSFPPPGTATLQSSAAQLAVKPPASFAQVAAEKAKAPTVASKVTASASGQPALSKRPLYYRQQRAPHRRQQLLAFPVALQTRRRRDKLCSECVGSREFS